MSKSPAKRNFEVEFFVKGPEGLNIKELLTIAPEYRTFQHCKEILKYVKNVKFIEKYMNTDNIYELAKHFVMESFKENDIICKQGDEASKFYFILSGSVRVSVEHDAEYKGFKEEIKVNELRRGDSFGEIALLYDVKRTASVIANERCDCVVIDKVTFRKYFDQNLNPNFAHIIEFYKSFFPLYQLEPEQLSALAGKSNPFKFGSDTILVRQGEPAQTVFYVRTGRLRILKKLWFKLKNNGELNLDDPTEPTPEQIAAGKAKQMVVDIDEIHSGESIGDYEVIHKEDMKISVMTVIPSEVIMLYKADIRALPDKILKIYTGACKTYPEDVDIRNKYLAQLKWTEWKEKLKTRLAVETEHKKRDFPSRLRRPLKRLEPLDKLPVISGSSKLSNGTLEVILPSEVSKERAKYDKNYDLDPDLQILMDDNHYSFYRPHMKRSGSMTTTALSLHRKSVSTTYNPKGQQTPSILRFEYSEPKHKSRDTSENMSNNFSKLQNLSSINPSPIMMNHASKKNVKFLDISSSNNTTMLRSENHSTENEISRIVRPRMKESVETNHGTDSMMDPNASEKLRVKLGMIGNGFKL